MHHACHELTHSPLEFSHLLDLCLAVPLLDLPHDAVDPGTVGGHAGVPGRKVLAAGEATGYDTFEGLMRNEPFNKNVSV